jgi:hypothetical protein
VAPFSTRLHSFYAEYEGEVGRSIHWSGADRWMGSVLRCGIRSPLCGPTLLGAYGPAFLPSLHFSRSRDVAISHVFYRDRDGIPTCSSCLLCFLPDFDARLRISILGRPELDIEFPNIADRFAPYLGWMDRPEVMKLQFEDLVNDKARALEAILHHFLARVPLDVPKVGMLGALEDSINPRRTPTFRSGKTGEWKRYFTPEHKQLFRSVAGDLLQRLGYESGNAW